MRVMQIIGSKGGGGAEGFFVRLTNALHDNGGQLLAVTLYKKGARSVASAITMLSTTHGKEVHHGIQAA